MQGQQEQATSQYDKENIPPGSDGQKQAQASTGKTPQKRDREEESSSISEENKKPRTLTRKDLEFDWDRSQLRDPRLTPGRKVPPCKEGLEVFHDINTCFKKGPNGSPTYDDAGFQLDYGKVAEWKKPRPYNKKCMVKGMEKSLKKRGEEDSRMVAMFFEGGECPDDVRKGLHGMFLLKDKVSKDLNIPWHKIGPAEIEQWSNKGFAKQNPKDYVEATVTEEEKKRFMSMLKGCSLRK
jgi:hypothetical protein